MRLNIFFLHANVCFGHAHAHMDMVMVCVHIKYVQTFGLKTEIELLDYRNP